MRLGKHKMTLMHDCHALVHHHHPALLHRQALILDLLLTFLNTFSTLILKPSFSQSLSLHRHQFNSLLRLISWNLTTRCLTVTGGGSVDDCSRLSQTSWLLNSLEHIVMFAHLLTWVFRKYQIIWLGLRKQPFRTQMVNRPVVYSAVVCSAVVSISVNSVLIATGQPLSICCRGVPSTSRYSWSTNQTLVTCRDETECIFQFQSLPFPTFHSHSLPSPVGYSYSLPLPVP